MRFLLHLVVTAFAFWVACRVVDGLSYTGSLPGLLLVALLFGLITPCSAVCSGCSRFR